MNMARELGTSRSTAAAAFDKASECQKQCELEMKTVGRRALKSILSHPDKVAVVIFARPYSGFVEEAHMGIPHKFASRGILTLPFDFLDYGEEASKSNMYWGMGQRLIKAARMVEKHPQLFGAYVTNFSCGPDSFLIGYFREIMGKKPSLTLELDSHTADAGLETRIEAFLDIVHAYRQIEKKVAIRKGGNHFKPAAIYSSNGRPAVRTSSDKILPLNDARVSVLLPSMGNSESLAAAFRGAGFKTLSHPPADEAILKLGRANTSCKECLPLILTTGTLLNYIQNHRKDGEVLVYFMPTAPGPCRFGQYATFMQDLIRRMKIPDTAILSLNSENGYTGLGNGFEKKAFWGICIADVMEDVRSMLLVNAKDPERAMADFKNGWQALIESLETGNKKMIVDTLSQIAITLGRTPLIRPVAEVPVISLIGEIFVRRDGLSRQYITEKLAKKGFAVRCSPIIEWLYYLDYLSLKDAGNQKLSLPGKLGVFIKNKYKHNYESQIRSILSRSGLVQGHGVDIHTIIQKGQAHISINLGGEAILTVGSALTEIADQSCGVISIGPFGCMPTRLSEAILGEAMTREGKLAAFPDDGALTQLLADVDDLPFLSIESDGSPFPQLITAKLETFYLRARRLNERMMDAKRNVNQSG